MSKTNMDIESKLYNVSSRFLLGDYKTMMKRLSREVAKGDPRNAQLVALGYRTVGEELPTAPRAAVEVLQSQLKVTDPEFDDPIDQVEEMKKRHGLGHVPFRGDEVDLMELAWIANSPVLDPSIGRKKGASPRNDVRVGSRKGHYTLVVFHNAMREVAVAEYKKGGRDWPQCRGVCFAVRIDLNLRGVTWRNGVLGPDKDEENFPHLTTNSMALRLVAAFGGDEAQYNALSHASRMQVPRPNANYVTDDYEQVLLEFLDFSLMQWHEHINRKVAPAKRRPLEKYKFASAVMVGNTTLDLTSYKRAHTVLQSHRQGKSRFTFVNNKASQLYRHYKLADVVQDEMPPVEAMVVTVQPGSPLARSLGDNSDGETVVVASPKVRPGANELLDLVLATAMQGAKAPAGMARVVAIWKNAIRSMDGKRKTAPEKFVHLPTPKEVRAFVTKHRFVNSPQVTDDEWLNCVRGVYFLVFSKSLFQRESVTKAGPVLKRKEDEAKISEWFTTFIKSFLPKQNNGFTGIAHSVKNGKPSMWIERSKNKAVKRKRIDVDADDDASVTTVPVVSETKRTKTNAGGKAVNLQAEIDKAVKARMADKIKRVDALEKELRDVKKRFNDTSKLRVDAENKVRELNDEMDKRARDGKAAMRQRVEDVKAWKDKYNLIKRKVDGGARVLKLKEKEAQDAKDELKKLQVAANRRVTDLMTELGCAKNAVETMKESYHAVETERNTLAKRVAELEAQLASRSPTSAPVAVNGDAMNVINKLHALHNEAAALFSSVSGGPPPPPPPSPTKEVTPEPAMTEQQSRVDNGGLHVSEASGSEDSEHVATPRLPNDDEMSDSFSLSLSD